MRRERPSFVYFLRPVGADGPVKIGCSSYPEERLQSFMLWSPVALEVVAKLHGDELLEWRFHQAFSDFHSHSEWFRSAPIITATIKAIGLGATDFWFLPRSATRLKAGRRPITYTPEARLAANLNLSLGQLTSRAGITAPRAIQAAVRAIRDEKTTLEERIDYEAVARKFIADPLGNGAVVSTWPRTQALFVAWCKRRSIDPAPYLRPPAVAA